jgi:hypothetical protein
VRGASFFTWPIHTAFSRSLIFLKEDAKLFLLLLIHHRSNNVKVVSVEVNMTFKLQLQLHSEFAVPGRGARNHFPLTRLTPLLLQMLVNCRYD